MPWWVATGQKIQSLISSWQTGLATKEAKVEIVHSRSMHHHCLSLNFRQNVVYVLLCCTLAHCIFSLIFAGLSVNSLMLWLKAKELSSDPEFKASLCWYTNWKRRHAISMRAKTTLAQRLPADMEERWLNSIPLCWDLNSIVAMSRATSLTWMKLRWGSSCQPRGHWSSLETQRCQFYPLVAISRVSPLS